MKNNTKGVITIFPVIAFLVIFYYFPLSSIVRLGLSNPKNMWISTLQNPLFARFLTFTITQAILTLVISTILGVIAGYILARKRVYGLTAFRTLITVPFIFPPLAILLGFVILFGNQGLIINALNISFNPYSFWGIIFSHVMYNISVIARVSESAFNSESHDFHVLAQTLDVSRWKIFWTITLPHIRPQLEAGMLLVFLYSFNSFAIVLILGEVRLQTLEVLIYSESRIGNNFAGSAILVIFQLIINLLVILLYSKKSYYSLTESNEPILREKKYSSKFTMILSSILLFSWLPVIALIFGVIVSRNTTQIIDQNIFSTAYNALIGTTPLRVFVNTIFFGVIVAIIALTFAILLVYGLSHFKNSNKIESIFTAATLLPMATSAISLSFGILLVYGTWKSFTNQVWIFIIVAQLLASLPFASRSILSAWSRIPTDLILVSQTLGVSSFETFKYVIFPHLKSSILVAVLFSFAISIGEFGATYYLVRGEWITLSISIYRLFGTRNIQLPIYYALLLIGTTIIVFAIIERFGNLELRV